VVNLAQAKAQKAQTTQDNTPTMPPARTFDFVDTDDNVTQVTGYIIGTPAFIGVGDEQGTILAVFPLGNLKRAVPTVEVQQPAAA